MTSNPASRICGLKDHWTVVDWDATYRRLSELSVPFSYCNDQIGIRRFLSHREATPVHQGSLHVFLCFTVSEEVIERHSSVGIDHYENCPRFKNVIREQDLFLVLRSCGQTADHK